MLKSMTGFGRCEMSTQVRKIIVEIKAVNHRYCDLSIKLPKKLNYFEVGIRSVLKEYIVRGKVDVFVTYEDYAQSKQCLKYNEDIATEYYNYLELISKTFCLKNDITAYALSRYPDVFTLGEQTVDEKEIWEQLESVVRKAAQSFVTARVQEGQHLKKDLIGKLNEMLSQVEAIETRTPSIVEEYRKKLAAKVQDLLGDNKLDESILATEITIYADKICVDEETVRLKSHIQHMLDTLETDNSIGRKLDFIAQEMNREANTILSKASDLDVSNIAIDLKTGIEKIREQIQNIE
ncbi:YicC/YloC family endoribonuclease [Anaeromicropila populeti]|uniref:TIGR00255 family protein n=1 Tax=Anaeromicropila populeti TaxID=37658 RepID=A0A1I6KWA6_9FIRM|nr:YicC/YloC family endoribonuclease [Anaeromicropila populeti]SFR95501.1 TIGR00255 family protein [Anaeromicropila populeti]